MKVRLSSNEESFTTKYDASMALASVLATRTKPSAPNTFYLSLYTRMLIRQRAPVQIMVSRKPKRLLFLGKIILNESIFPVMWNKISLYFFYI
jgi:hypothetical protein